MLYNKNNEEIERNANISSNEKLGIPLPIIFSERHQNDQCQNMCCFILYLPKRRSYGSLESTPDGLEHGDIFPLSNCCCFLE